MNFSFIFQIITVLESPHTPEIKEQALCIIGNIAAGAGITDYVMENECILKKLFDFIVSGDLKRVKPTAVIRIFQ